LKVLPVRSKLFRRKNIC